MYEEFTSWVLTLSVFKLTQSRYCAPIISTDLRSKNVIELSYLKFNVYAKSVLTTLSNNIWSTRQDY